MFVTFRGLNKIFTDMKLDFKAVLNTAIGIAVGMVAYHFISKAIADRA